MIASFEKRVRGIALDTAIAFGAVCLLFGVGLDPYIKWIIFIIILFLVYCLPNLFFCGQSLGKKAQRIKVININNNIPSRFILIIRDLLKIFLCIISFGIYPVICAFMLSPKNQNRLFHDYIFKTVVVDLDNVKYHNVDFINRNKYF